MEIGQGEIWWANLPEPVGSEPGYRRPMVIVQGNPFNRSGIATVVCVPLTTNLRLATAPGNVALAADATGLPRDSVANVSQVTTVDRRRLTEQMGRVSASQLELIFRGIDIVLGR